MTDARHLTDEYLDRVRRSYLLSVDRATISADSMWGQIAMLNRPVHEALLAGDIETVRAIFAAPLSSDLFYGVDSIARTMAAKVSQFEAPLAQQARQCMLLLAEAVGIRRWLPSGSEQEQNYYPPDHDPSPDIDIVVGALSEAMGFDIQFPNPFAGEVGVSTSRGIASYRAIQALYQCHRLQQELQGVNRQSVIEIGPGMGRTAFFARAAGVVDYTTVDLALGVVAQACFLGAVLGPDAVWMIADPPGLAAGRIRLLPSGHNSLENKRFSLLLNADSMTEMGAESSANYARWLATHVDMFISVNHEANGPVIAELARRFFPSAAARRYPYWMRLGYVEEVFRFKDTQRVLAVHVEDLSAEDRAIKSSAFWNLTTSLRILRRLLGAKEEAK